MSNISKGLLSGFIATVVLTVFMVLRLHFHITHLSVLNLLSKIAGGGPNAWADHVIIGVALWGLLFAGFDAVTPERLSYWLKGVIFSVLTWLVMMIFFMPVAGAGFFGEKEGLAGALVPLVQHLIYGITLGVTYGLLTDWFPVREEAADVPVRKAKATG